MGNTLVLLNGHQIMTHATSQADGLSLVPTLTYNTNAIPTAGVQRLETLRDGAGRHHGADAVAGVVNTVLKNNFDGLQVEAQYGAAQGTDMSEYSLNGLWGHNFERGNLTAFVSYNNRSALRSLDQVFTASSDKRGLFAGTRFDGAAQPRWPRHRDALGPALRRPLRSALARA